MPFPRRRFLHLVAAALAAAPKLASAQNAGDYAELPGVKLWFTDTDSLNAGFASDAGRTLMTHATEFIAEISTFLVETHEVV